MRPREKVHPRSAQQSAAQAALAVLREICGRIGQLSARDVRRVPPEPCHDARIEALDAKRSVVCAQQRQRFLAQQIVARAGFQLHDQRRAAAHRVQHFREEGNVLLRAAQAHRTQFLERERVHAPVNAAHAIERVVVKDDDLRVFRGLHVQLDAIPRVSRRAERGQAVFGRQAVFRVQPAVRAIETVEPRHARRRTASGRKQEQDKRRSQNSDQQDPPYHIRPTPCPARCRIFIIIVRLAQRDVNSHK